MKNRRVAIPLEATKRASRGRTTRGLKRFEGRRVPEILLGGHHAHIEQWRQEQGLQKMTQVRPDLLAKKNRVRKKKMNALVDGITEEQLKTDIPEFNVGDTVRVHVRIIEGDKERVQVLTGTVIARKGKGIAETFSIYRVAYGASMERVFPLHSPRVAKIEVMRKGKTRRSKLYFLRGLQGKKSTYC